MKYGSFKSGVYWKVCKTSKTQPWVRQQNPALSPFSRLNRPCSELILLNHVSSKMCFFTTDPKAMEPISWTGHSAVCLLQIILGIYHKSRKLTNRICYVSITSELKLPWQNRGRIEEAQKSQETQKVPILMRLKVTRAVNKYWVVRVCFWWNCPHVGQRALRVQL